MISSARVNTGIDSGNVQHLQVQFNVDEVRDDTPRLAEFGFSSMPPTGSDAVVLLIGGDHSNGVIVATGHKASRPTGLAPGESIVYSQDGKYVKFTAAGGIVVEAKGQDVVVNNAANVNITASTKVTLTTPLVEITGNLQVDGDATAGGKSLKTHVHSGVQPGAGNSGPPV